MKKILLTGMMLCLLATSAFAVGGLNFNWSASSACPAIATANQTWDCAGPSANAGTFYWIASVVANVAVPGFNAMDARIDGQFTAAPPAWWTMECRPTSFVPGTPSYPLSASICGTSAIWNGTPYGGVGVWQNDPGNRFHTVIGFATALNRVANLSLTIQYSVFHVRMNTSNSLYVPADPDNEIEEVPLCVGCDMPATLVLNQIGLYGSGPEDQVTLPGVTQQCITWQGGAGPGVCAATPARNTTWGQVKSLYR